MTAKKEVMKKSELVSDQRPDWMKNDSSRGSEEVTSNDVTLPRLQIIQDLSKQHKKNKEEYIEGAEVGDFFNTATQQLYKESTLIVPVYFRTEWIIWKDQEAGGGFFGAYPNEREAKAELPNAVKSGGGTPEQYEIVDTDVHFVLLVNEQDPTDVEQVVISMAKSQKKVSRNLNTMAKIAGGDRFSRMYRLATFTDKNKAGQEFMNWAVKPVGWVNEDLYRAAEATYEAIRAGERGVDYGSEGEAQSQATEPKKEAEFDDEFAV